MKVKVEIGSKWINSNNIKITILGTLSYAEVKKMYPWLSSAEPVYKCKDNNGEFWNITEEDFLKYYKPLKEMTTNNDDTHNTLKNNENFNISERNVKENDINVANNVAQANSQDKELMIDKFGVPFMRDDDGVLKIIEPALSYDECQSLTELWKKGELEDGEYYIRSNKGHIYIDICANGSFMFTNYRSVEEVLAEVPSWEEWLESESHCAVYSEINKGLKEENQRLKEKYNNIKVNGNYPDKISKLKSRIKGLTEELEPFTNPYFKGLTTKDIAELAKKSIRLTTQHCKDNEEIEILREQLDLKNDMVDRIIVENEKLQKWCEEFNALDVAKENLKFKDLLKDVRNLWNGTVFMPTTQQQVQEVLNRIDEVLK